MREGKEKTSFIQCSQHCVSLSFYLQALDMCLMSKHIAYIESYCNARCEAKHVQHMWTRPCVHTHNTNSNCQKNINSNYYLNSNFLCEKSLSSSCLQYFFDWFMSFSYDFRQNWWQIHTFLCFSLLIALSLPPEFIWNPSKMLFDF